MIIHQRDQIYCNLVLFLSIFSIRSRYRGLGFPSLNLIYTLIFHRSTFLHVTSEWNLDWTLTLDNDEEFVSVVIVFEDIFFSAKKSELEMFGDELEFRELQLLFVLEKLNALDKWNQRIELFVFLRCIRYEFIPFKRLDNFF
mgnify:CR=1 FL=1